MSRTWFTGDLETVATFWRIYRRDGVTIGLTSHDRDLFFANVRHHGAPGMVPSAIRFSAGFDPDSAEIEGALDHSAISGTDLAAGRFDGARIVMGLVDWETFEHFTLYSGSVGAVGREGERFTADLHSQKSRLSIDPIPRTSPTCRAVFAGPGCNLSAVRFTHEATVSAIDLADNAVTIAGGPPVADLLDGDLRWHDGPMAGLQHRIAGIDGGRLVLDPIIDEAVSAGTSVAVREGCDHRLQTCANRFANAANFRGEPFLPGNDMLTRYPAPKG